MAQWHLNDDFLGTDVEDAFGVYTGTSVRTTDVVHATGKVGSGAFTFNGSSDYVDFGSDVTLRPLVGAVSAWVKLPADTYAPIIGWKVASTLGIWATRNSSPLIWMSGYSYFSADVLDGDWHHMVFNYGSASAED